MNIPLHLVDRTVSGLQVSYAEYLAYTDAQKALAKLVANGRWPASQKKPKSEDLIEVFISKSAFFKNYQPYFPRIEHDYPVLHLWLKNEEDVPTDLEAWGFQKNTYMFKDLEDFLERVKPGKGKESSGKKGNKSSDKKKGGRAV